LEFVKYKTLSLHNLSKEEHFILTFSIIRIDGWKVLHRKMIVKYEKKMKSTYP